MHSKMHMEKSDVNICGIFTSYIPQSIGKRFAYVRNALEQTLPLRKTTLSVTRNQYAYREMWGNSSTTSSPVSNLNSDFLEM